MKILLLLELDFYETNHTKWFMLCGSLLDTSDGMTVPSSSSRRSSKQFLCHQTDGMMALNKASSRSIS